VYNAEDTKLGRSVALKFLPADVAPPVERAHGPSGSEIRRQWREKVRSCHFRGVTVSPAGRRHPVVHVFAQI